MLLVPFVITVDVNCSLQVLEADRSDHEIVNYALETLVNVTAPEVFAEECGKLNSDGCW